MRTLAATPKNYSEQNLGNCCGCLPLRIGCYLICLVYFIDSLYALFGFVSEDTRLTAGGFNTTGRMISATFGLIGAFCTFLGFIGLHDNSPVWVRTLCYYLIAHTVLITCLYLYDMHVLSDCEEAKKMAFFTHRAEGYNPAIEAISMAGKCKSTRSTYTMYAILDLLFSIYAVIMVRRFCVITESSPTYLIHLEETRPLSTVSTPISVKGFGNQPKQNASPALSVTPGLIQAQPPTAFQWNPAAVQQQQQQLQVAQPLRAGASYPAPEASKPTAFGPNYGAGGFASGSAMPPTDPRLQPTPAP